MPSSPSPHFLLDREQIRKSAFPFGVSVLVLWGPYLVWAALDTSMSQYVWPNFLAAPLLAPVLIFPGWESMDPYGKPMEIVEQVVGEAIRFESTTWQHVLFCIGAVAVLVAMTVLARRGRWWFLAVALSCLALQVIAIVRLETG